MLVVETCAPKMGVGTWAIEGTVGSAAMTSMVEVLGTRVVDTTARSVGIEMPDVVEVAVEKDGGRVKARRAAQVAGFSPCGICGQIVLGRRGGSLRCGNRNQLQERRSLLAYSSRCPGGSSSKDLVRIIVV